MAGSLVLLYSLATDVLHDGVWRGSLCVPSVCATLLFLARLLLPYPDHL